MKNCNIIFISIFIVYLFSGCNCSDCPNNLTSYVDKIKWEIPTPMGDYAETITDAHTRCDGKIGYLLEKKRIEFFISVYNLCDSKDKEYPFAEEIRRRVIGGFNYSF